MADRERKVDYEEILDLGELISALYKKLWLCILTAILCAGAGFCYSKFGVTPQYQADAAMIVNSGYRSSDYVTGDQMSTSASLVELYGIIIKSDVVMDTVYENVSAKEEIPGTVTGISVSSVNNTQVMVISVNATSAECALAVCKEITEVAPDRIIKYMGAGSIRLLSAASGGERPVSPDLAGNTGKAGLFGFIAACGIIVLITLLNNRVKKEEDFRRMDLCLLGVIPGYGRRKRTFLLADSRSSFDYREAYKTLRTNLDFLAAKHQCKSIMVTSPMPGDGKTTAAVNLAYVLGMAGKKVILLDGDMRAGTVAAYVSMEGDTSGLAEILTGERTAEDSIVHRKDLKTDLVTAGVLPSNPAELAGSEAMDRLLRELEEAYDYVIIDTPPVSVVTDAVALGRIADGVLLVARANVTARPELDRCRKRLADVDAHILGAVLNDYSPAEHLHRKKKYFR